MKSTVNNSSWLSQIYGWVGYSPQQTPEGPDIRIASAMQRIVGQEQALAKKAIHDPWKRFPVGVIGGAALNVGQLALTGVSVLAACAAISNILTGIGLLGGLLNIKEGAIAIHEGLHAWKSNDKQLAAKLFLQGILSFGLGTVMVLLSVARFVALSGVVGFFAANPYILPVLGFVLAIFLLIDMVNRLSPVIQGKDLGSKLELAGLRSMLETNTPEKGMEKAMQWVHSNIKECISEDPTKTDQAVQTKLNEYKAEIGFTAAMETFQLFEMILHKQKKEEILKQVAIVENKISQWNKILYYKTFSVLIAAMGSGAAIGGIALRSNPVNGADDFLMSAAGVVPLYFDICRPFERDTPLETDLSKNAPDSIDRTG
jgi:hypothetical protein